MIHNWLCFASIRPNDFAGCAVLSEGVHDRVKLGWWRATKISILGAKFCRSLKTKSTRAARAQLWSKIGVCEFASACPWTLPECLRRVKTLWSLSAYNDDVKCINIEVQLITRSEVFRRQTSCFRVHLGDHSKCPYHIYITCFYPPLSTNRFYLKQKNQQGIFPVGWLQAGINHTQTFQAWKTKYQVSNWLCYSLNNLPFLTTRVNSNTKKRILRCFEIIS